MGTGGSFMRSHDDEDILGSDLEGINGVLKRIPIEIKPRGKLGLRSVGSLGKSKPKGGSLRSALSIDLENPEVERIRKDFEMYRLNKDNEMANMQKKEQKLETENKRLRAELLALQKTCTRMRGERDAALEAEQEVLARASVFESDRDKVQRQFKLFRETKESEIQNLLRAKQEIENRLSKVGYACHTADDSDSHSGHGIVNLSNSHPGDWWTALESEPSLGSTVQLHQPAFLRGPEFASTSLEIDGPFINVNKEDWNLALLNSHRVFPSISPQMLTHTIRVYATVSPDMMSEFNKFTQEHLTELRELCEGEGRGLTLVHLPQTESVDFEREAKVRKLQVDTSVIVIAFLGSTLHEFCQLELRHAHLDHQGNKTSICLMSETSESKGNKSSQEMRELKRKVREMVNSRVHITHTSPNPGNTAQAAAKELERVLKTELGMDRDCSDQILSDCLVSSRWDVQCDSEQQDLLYTAVMSTYQIGFEKYYDHLSSQVSAAGPLPPLLVIGNPGCGKSLLLAKWLQLQEEHGSTCLFLYHFVGSPTSVSADPIIMIRRLTAQLMQQVSTPPALTSDPIRLVEEFPRWLEKVSAKSPSGVILVLDSVDRFQQAEVHLKWLLDPLPVDARVIVSVNEMTCPEAWRSWPTLHMETCSSKQIKEILWAELSSLGSSVDTEMEQRILTHCRSTSTCCPLYISLLARHIASVDPGLTEQHLTVLLSCKDNTEVYRTFLDFSVQILAPECQKFLKGILQFLYASRCGMLESELLSLIPELSWVELSSIFEYLSSHLVVRYQLGLLTFAHAQAESAAHDYSFEDKSVDLQSVRQALIQHFQEMVSPVKLSGRVVDELPWLVRQTGDKQQLERCILDLGVFQQMCIKGRCSELLSHWQLVGGDKEKMAEAYFSATKSFEVDVSTR